LADTIGKFIIYHILKLKLFREFEDLFLDTGLAKTMKEVEDDEELDLGETKRLSGFKNGC
jgi:hypothetical protein